MNDVTLVGLSNAKLTRNRQGREQYEGTVFFSLIEGGKLHEAKVVCYSELDCMSFDEYCENLDASEEEKQKSLEKLNNDQAMIAQLSVEVDCEGVSASDYLGGVWCESHEDFVQTVNDNTMIFNAITELKEKITAIVNKFGE